jgi:hypothetical protein
VFLARRTAGNWLKEHLKQVCGGAAVILLLILIVSSRSRRPNAEPHAEPPGWTPDMLAQAEKLRAAAVSAHQSAVRSSNHAEVPPSSAAAVPERNRERSWLACCAAMENKNGRKALLSLRECLETGADSREAAFQFIARIVHDPGDYHLDVAGVYSVLEYRAALPLIEYGLANTDDPGLRRLLIHALAWNDNEHAEDAILRELAGEQDAAALLECIRSIDGRDSPALRDALARCMNSQQREPEARVAAAMTLGRLQDPAVDELIAAAAHNDPTPAMREQFTQVLRTRYSAAAGILVTSIAQLPENDALKQNFAQLLGLDLQSSDVLVACDGIECKSIAQITEMAAASKADDHSVSLQILRNGKPVEIKTTGMQLSFALGRLRGCYVSPGKEKASAAVNAALQSQRGDASGF